MPIVVDVVKIHGFEVMAGFPVPHRMGEESDTQLFCGYHLKL